MGVRNEKNILTTYLTTGVMKNKAPTELKKKIWNTKIKHVASPLKIKRS